MFIKIDAMPRLCQIKEFPASFLFPEQSYYIPELGVWLSVDPLSDKYPSMSAFMYCAGNPVVLVDPDGREVFITGTESNAAVNDLQKGLNNIKIERNEKTGKLSVTGDPITESEKQIFSAINDKKVRVNVTAENSENIYGDPKIGSRGGSFLGTQLKKEKNSNGTSTTTVDAFQFVNPEMLAKLDRDEFCPVGQNMKHEVTEGYQAGLISLKKNKPAPAAFSVATRRQRAIYNKAHNKALPQSWASDKTHDASNAVKSQSSSMRIKH